MIKNSKFKIKNLGPIAVLIVVGFSVYAFNLSNPLFWDDTDWIVNNPFVHSFSLENIGNWFTKNTLAGIGLKSNYYRPFLFLTFALNYIISGTAPLGYHLASNGLHVLNAILIFYILLSIFRNKFIAFWSAILWLVHPLQTEAVTYISGRGDPLNVFFMLSALYLWTNDMACRYDKTVDNRQSSPGMGDAPLREHRKSVIRSVAPLFLLTFALLSRETAIVFPFIFMLFYIAFISREKLARSFKQAFVMALPYFGIVFVYGILRLTVLNFDNTLNFYSKANPYTESFLVRMYTFLNVLLTYAKLLILPLGQHMERNVTIYTYFFNWSVATSFFIVLTVLGLVWCFYRKQKYSLHMGQVNDFRLWFFAVGWFFVNLGPTSGITPINAQLYEHWLYLAMLGPIVFIVYYLDVFRKRHLKTINIGVIIVLLIFVSFFSVLSVKRNILWGDPIKFFQDILKYEPDGARINNNLGNLYYDKGDEEKAEEYYWKSVSIEDNFPQPHFNLGSILQSRGDIRGAVVEFEKAIKIDPNFPYAYGNLAVIYAGQGDLISATNAFEKLKTITPYNPQIYYNLALIYLERKDNEIARQNLQEGLKYAQFDPETGILMRDLFKRLKK